MVGRVTLVRDEATGESCAELEDVAQRALLQETDDVLMVARALNVSRRLLRL